MYLVDTNFLGHLENFYPDAVFPSLWSQLVHRLFVPSVFFHHEVDKELQRWAHPRLDWYNAHVDQKQILGVDQLELDHYTDVTRWVANTRQPQYRSYAVNQFFSAADSWLVASASRHGASIVTAEVAAPDSVKKVKIPDVAQHFGVPVLTPLDFLQVLKVRV